MQILKSRSTTLNVVSKTGVQQKAVAWLCLVPETFPPSLTDPQITRPSLGDNREATGRERHKDADQTMRGSMIHKPLLRHTLTKTQNTSTKLQRTLSFLSQREIVTGEAKWMTTKTQQDASASHRQHFYGVRLRCSVSGRRRVQSLPYFMEPVI